MHIQLFGNVTAVHAGNVVQFQTRKIGTLFAYLAAHVGVTFTRTQLATLFWGEYPDRAAKRNLSTSLNRLKKAVRATGAPYPVRVARQTISFQPTTGVTVDLHRFDDLWAQCEAIDRALWAERGQSVQLLTEAVELYQGGFLDGIDLSDSIEFDAWLMVQRQRYHERALLGLETIAEYHLRQGNWAQVEQFAGRQLTLEPWHERAHQQLIQLYVQTNRPDTAQAQYEWCKQILWDELAIEPSAETEAAIAALGAQPTQKPIHHTFISQTNSSSRENVGRQSNLPTDETPFLGRTHELAQLQTLVRERTYRLITLVGQGGAGKTRLGLALARSQLPYFAHGVHFVSLVGVHSAENIPHTIANNLKLTLAGESPPLQQLCRYLHERELLLVLDNIEQLLAQDATLDMILELHRAAPDLVLLVTSRSQLWVRAETVFSVGGLSYPVHQQAQALGARDLAASYDAIRLFDERSQRLNFNFTLQKELRDVIRICQLVDGLPLGLELAAANSAITSCAEVANRLEASIKSLATRMRDMPARQRSLRAAFEYSWHLLSPVSQRILTQLSIFRDDFSSEMVTAIVPAATGEQLQLLKRHSLLSRESAGRYRLHEMVRQFAATRLDSAEKPILETHYLQTYLTYLTGQQPTLEGAEPHTAVVKLRPDFNNMLHAWQLALDHTSFTLLRTTIQSFAILLHLRSLHHLGRQLFDRAIRATQSSNHPEADQARAHIQIEGARFLMRLSQYDETIQLTDEAIRLADAYNDKWAVGNAANVQAEAWWRKGAYQTALDVLQQHRASVACSQRLLGSYYFNLGRIYQLQRQFDAADCHLQNALSMWQQIGHKRFEATTLSALGVMRLDEQVYVEASQYFQQALEIAQQIEDRYLTALAHVSLAGVMLNSQQYDVAKAHSLEAYSYFQDSGDLAHLSLVLNNLGWVHYNLNELSHADEVLQRALQYAESSGSRFRKLQAMSNLADVKVQLNDVDQAISMFKLAHTGWAEIGRVDFANLVRQKHDSLQATYLQ